MLVQFTKKKADRKNIKMSQEILIKISNNNKGKLGFSFDRQSQSIDKTTSGPAKTAGLKKGDVVLECNGVVLADIGSVSVEEWKNIVLMNDPITMLVYRSEKQQQEDSKENSDSVFKKFNFKGKNKQLSQDNIEQLKAYKQEIKEQGGLENVK